MKRRTAVWVMGLGVALGIAPGTYAQQCEVGSPVVGFALPSAGSSALTVAGVDVERAVVYARRETAQALIGGLLSQNSLVQDPECALALAPVAQWLARV